MEERVVIVGDIHGCLLELKDLLSRVYLSRKDRLVLVGDLVDKGPDSPGVVSFLRGLRDHGYRVDLVLGNHEETHLRWVRHDEEHRVKLKKDKGIREIQSQLQESDVEFLRSSSLFVELPEVHSLVVHGGIPSSWSSLPRDIDKLSGKKRKNVLKACRLRYVDEDGKFLTMSKADPSIHSFWAEKYDGRFGRVFYGHESRAYVRINRYAMGLDSDCVYGGKLTAAVIPCSDPYHIAIVSVPARKAYAAKCDEVD